MQNFFSKVADFFKQDSDIPQTDTHWFSESGVIDLFVMLGPKPKDVFKQYAVLTGTTPVPPVSLIHLIFEKISSQGFSMYTFVFGV